MEVAVAVPPVMATTEAPTLSPDKRAGARPDQSADGAAYHSTDNGTSYRMTSLRHRRLREKRSNNHDRCKRQRYSVQHLSVLLRVERG
jgi:hypothetical protein